MTRHHARLPLLMPLLAWAVLGAAGTRHVEVSAVFEPAESPEKPPAILVWLEPKAADYVVNEQPAPRLTLDPEQRILEDRQPLPPSGPPADPEAAGYRDPDEPVRFPVAVLPGAAPGLHRLSAQVTFFYCSKSAGWCRKGKENVDVAVRLKR